ncbi:MAG: flagellin FliC, partial [Chakrabartia sp.]
MDAKVRGLSQAIRNANDGISLVQTAEGAMSEISNILVRMRELSVQSANGTSPSTDRTSLQAEFTALIAQIGVVASRTDFNGIKPLNGSTTTAGIKIQTGVNTAEAVTITIADLQAAATNVAVSTLDISTDTGASSALATLDTAINTVAAERAK